MGPDGRQKEEEELKYLLDFVKEVQLNNTKGNGTTASAPYSFKD